MHIGQHVEDAVRKSGFSLTVVAKRLGISRRTLYQWFTYPDLSSAKVYRVGNVINHDFTTEIEDMATIASENEYHYNSGMPPDYKKILLERDKYLRMYHELVDKHNEAMEKIIRLQEELNKFKS